VRVNRATSLRARGPAAVMGGAVGLAAERELRPEDSGAFRPQSRGNGEVPHQRVGGRRDAPRARCRGITLPDGPVSACDRGIPLDARWRSFPRERPKTLPSLDDA
jgi:hypothetical protein